MGRPTKDQVARDERITIRIAAVDRRALEEFVAKHDKMSVNDLILEALRYYMRKKR